MAAMTPLPRSALDALWCKAKRWSLAASASIVGELIDACPALALLRREHRRHLQRVFAALEAGAFDSPFVSNKYET